MIDYQVAAKFLPHPDNDGSVALVASWPNTYTRGNDAQGKPIPSQNGDVISVQPDGSIQVRPANAIGAWEKGKREGVAWTATSADGVIVVMLPVSK